MLNSLELSVQDVHLDCRGFRKCALGWIYFMRRVLVCRRVLVSQPRHVQDPPYDWLGNVRKVFDLRSNTSHGHRLRQSFLVTAPDADDNDRAKRIPLSRAQAPLSDPPYIFLFFLSNQRMLRLVSAASRPTSNGWLSRFACSDCRNNRMSICISILHLLSTSVYLHGQADGRFHQHLRAWQILR
jgi:hypothetical protein